MSIDSSLIEAVVYYHDPNKERYFVKITFVELGMFINSFSVQPSKYEGQPLWVQPPKHRQRNGFTPTVDFDKSYPLWEVIEQKALEAVGQFNDTNTNSDGKDTLVEAENGEVISLKDIPF